MEDIFVSLPPDQQEWLADQLGPTVSIKDLVKQLLVEKFNTSQVREGDPSAA
jgi:hypothetical protein